MQLSVLVGCAERLLRLARFSVQNTLRQVGRHGDSQLSTTDALHKKTLSAPYAGYPCILFRSLFN